MLASLALSLMLQAPPPPPAPAADVSAQAAIDAGLKAFSRRRYREAAAQFQKAADANPNSAAALFYLGYAEYKLAEPKRPFHPDKQKAAALFAKAYAQDPAFRPVWGPRKK